MKALFRPLKFSYYQGWCPESRWVIVCLLQSYEKVSEILSFLLSGMGFAILRILRMNENGQSFLDVWL